MLAGFYQPREEISMVPQLTCDGPACWRGVCPGSRVCPIIERQEVKQWGSHMFPVFTTTIKRREVLIRTDATWTNSLFRIIH